MSAKGVPFHIITKPIGALCNLKCAYCFYLEKGSMYPAVQDLRMLPATLERYITTYIQEQPGPVVSFSWQGGEPTLLGIDFFESVVHLQQKNCPPDKTIENAIQTNGTKLTAKWCTFLKKHNFLVGLSLDGPPDFQDMYRRGGNDEPTSGLVLQGLELLKGHDVDFNILCVVNKMNGEHPQELYHYFKGIGAEHIQFIPLVEKEGDGQTVTSRSISGEAFGHFLTDVFNEWVQVDMGNVFIQTFESMFSAYMGYGATLCSFGKMCGHNLALEHNGDIYPCDHYVEPPLLLGNIGEVSFQQCLALEKQQTFGRSKYQDLPSACMNCTVLSLCYGGCPKNRLDGKNWLCAGYRQFFQYVQPFFQVMAEAYHSNRPVSSTRVKVKELYEVMWNNVGRNDLCPCQSGRKFKKCCG